MELAEFLLARVAEDEAAATGANDHDRWQVKVDESGDAWVTEVDVTQEEWRVAMAANPAVGWHIARHDPTRVLADCEAKRRIVEIMREGGWEAGWTLADRVLGNLALPYVDHPDYRPEWKP